MQRATIIVLSVLLLAAVALLIRSETTQTALYLARWNEVLFEREAALDDRQAELDTVAAECTTVDGEPYDVPWED